MSFDDSISLGQAALTSIQGIERKLSKLAPEDFPNRLTEEGYPVDLAAMLCEKIAGIETRLLTKLAAGNARNIDVERLKHAIECGIAYIDSEKASLSSCRPAGWRFHNPADSLELTLLRQRLAYLTELEQQFCESGIIDEQVNDV